MREEHRPTITCPGCNGGGRFLTECCNGAGGCSCRGQVVDLGPCNVCGGHGEVVEGGFDPRANLRKIKGLHFIGSGPNDMHGIWPNRGNLI